ncbi:MAG: hypothetical protein ACQCN3_00510 [Candidatus Bathyarchaeia archaeon]
MATVAVLFSLKENIITLSGTASLGCTNMPLAVKKKQERTIARCGNSVVLYLPKGYFMPGEKVNLDLEIDFDGNLKLALSKCIFHFNCEKLKAALQNNFKIVFDEADNEAKSFTAETGNLSINCISYTQELEPTYVTICRLFDGINSAETYTALDEFVQRLRQTCPDAYIEPEGNIDYVKIYKNPKKYHLENEIQSVEFLRKSGKKLDYSVIVKFNSKTHTLEAIMQTLECLRQKDEVLLAPP